LWVPFFEIKDKEKWMKKHNQIRTKSLENWRSQNWRFFRNYPTLVYKIGFQGGESNQSEPIHLWMHHERYDGCTMDDMWT